MQSEFGITCTAKEWFASYLSVRTNRVCVLGDYADDQVLKHGVPQGSIAGPPIFTAYAQPVANIISRFQIGYIYADDTLLYVSFNPKSKEIYSCRKAYNEPMHRRNKIVDARKQVKA